MANENTVTDGWVVSRADVLGGKPCIRGTRISVQFVLELLAGGLSLSQIAEQYPHVPREGLEAAVQFAAGTLTDVTWDERIQA